MLTTEWKILLNSQHSSLSPKEHSVLKVLLQKRHAPDIGIHSVRGSAEAVALIRIDDDVVRHVQVFEYSGGLFGFRGRAARCG